MADLVAIRVKCPECGATTPASADIVTCTYCGTESRVQRRTQVFQRPIELPPPGLMQPRTVALQRSNKAPWLVLGVTFGGPLLVAAIVVTTSHVDPSAVSRVQPARPSDLSWATRHPLLVDLDGDGIEDAIGIVRYTGGRDATHIRAVSGSTGKALWETPALGTFDHTDRSELALASQTVLFADTVYKPRLEAYDARTGAKRWSVAPGEVVMDLCRDRDGRVKLVTKDEAAFSIELATGASTPLPKPGACVPLPSTEPHDVTLDTNNPHWGFAPPGMQSDQIVGDRSSWILSGYKSPGTSIPMIAVIDDHERVKWTSQLASTDPMSSKRLINQLVAYDATLVATVYGRYDDKLPPTLVAFDRARGTRLFETALRSTGLSFSTSIGLEVGPTTIWVPLYDGLRAYDRKTGALRWELAD